MADPMVEPKAGGHSFWLFVPLAVPFVILAAVAVYGITRPPSSSGPPAPGRPGSLVWGQGIFANRVELKAWFALHGGNYEVWAKHHPAALRLVPVSSRQSSSEQEQAHVAAANRTAQQKAAQRVAAARSIGISTPAAGRSWSSGANLVLWILIVMGVLLGVAAAAPERLVRDLPGAAFWKERELRIGSAAAGVALLVGVAISTQLS
jgi:hypothetical protein